MDDSITSPMMNTNYVDSIQNNSEMNEIAKSIYQKEENIDNQNKSKYNVQVSRPLDVISYVKEILRLPLDSLIDLILLNIIKNKISFTFKCVGYMFFFVTVISLLCWFSAILYYFLESLDFFNTLTTTIIVLITALLLAGFTAIILLSFKNQLLNSESFSESTLQNTFISLKKQILHNIITKIDLRANAGDDAIIQKYKPQVELLNAQVFEKIIPFFISKGPILLVLCTNLFLNPQGTITTLLNQQNYPWLLETAIHIISILSSGCSINEDKINNLTDIMKNIFAIISTIEFLLKIMLCVYILITIFSLYLIKTDAIDPLEYAKGIISYRDNLLTCGFYNSQVNVLTNLLKKFAKDKLKWNVLNIITISIILSLTLMIICYICWHIEDIVQIFSIDLDLLEILYAGFIATNMDKVNKWIKNIVIIFRFCVAISLLIYLIIKVVDAILQFYILYEMESVVSIILTCFWSLQNLKIDFTAYKPLNLQVNTIVLNNVSVGYTPDGFILKDINLIISKGQEGNKVIFVIGESGSGKTTMFNGISGKLYTDGQIMISDGINMQNIALIFPQDRKAIIHQVAQRPEFPNRDAKLTIYEYLHQKTRASREKCRSVLLQYLFGTNIKEVDAFLDRALGINGQTLSGGEKTRLECCIAELLYPIIKCIDESLDNLNFAMVKEILLTLCSETSLEQSSVILISHKVILLLDILFAEKGLNGLSNIYIWYIADGKLQEFNVLKLIQSGKLQSLLENVSGPQTQKDIELSPVLTLDHQHQQGVIA